KLAHGRGQHGRARRRVTDAPAARRLGFKLSVMRSRDLLFVLRRSVPASVTSMVSRRGGVRLAPARAISCRWAKAGECGGMRGRAGCAAGRGFHTPEPPWGIFTR